MTDINIDDGISVSVFSIVKSSNFDHKIFAEILEEIANGFGTSRFSANVAREVMGMHRTLQQGIIRMLLEIVVAYAKTDRGFDDRNQAAVEGSQKIAKFIEDQGIYFPLI